MPAFPDNLRMIAWPARQRGMVATFIAIIVLVATLIAAAALIISTNTSNQIAGNMGFRQGLVQESERAYAAINNPFPYFGQAGWADAPGAGYYAEIQPATTRLDIPDVLTSNPVSAGVTAVLPVNAATGNVVHYVIERLSLAAGQPQTTPPNSISPGQYVGGSGSGANQASDQAPGAPPTISPAQNPAFRLTVRVDGPRNTIGYMQTILAQHN